MLICIQLTLLNSSPGWGSVATPSAARWSCARDPRIRAAATAAGGGGGGTDLTLFVLLVAFDAVAASVIELDGSGGGGGGGAGARGGEEVGATFGLGSTKLSSSTTSSSEIALRLMCIRIEPS